jgi:hypothetical protein
MRRPSLPVLPHDPYLYVHRISGVGGLPVYGVKCQCGWASRRTNHPTRQTALDDWTKHRDKETR